MIMHDATSSDYRELKNNASHSLKQSEFIVLEYYIFVGYQSEAFNKCLMLNKVETKKQFIVYLKL